MTIWSRFKTVAMRSPRQIAITTGDESISYEDLLQRADDLVPAIREADMGGVTAITSSTPIEVFARMLASLRCEIPYWVIPRGLSVSQIAGIKENLAATSFSEDFPGEPSPQVSLDSPIQSHPVPAAIYLTSGSTGVSKLVRRTQHQILRRVDLYCRACKFSADDRFLLMTDPGFIASEGDIFCSLLSGAELACFDASVSGLSSFSDFINGRQITVIHPPVGWFTKWRANWSKDDSFPSVRRILLGGSALPTRLLVDLWDHFAASAKVYHRYSSTEAGPVAQFVVTKQSKLSSELVPIGWPFESLEWRIATDSEGEGELLIKSDLVAPSVHRDADGFYATGDWVRQTAEGLAFVARKDSIVKVRGYRVNLQEIKAAIEALPTIDEAQLVALGSESRYLVACIVPKHQAEFDVATLRPTLAQSLAPWQLPSRFIALNSIPCTPTGKPDLAKLKQLVENDSDSRTYEYSELESELAEIWTALSEYNRPIDPTTSLLQQGGDSLTVVAFLAQVESRYQRRISPYDFVRHQDLKSLARLIDEGAIPPALGSRMPQAEPALTPLNQEGYPALVCFPTSADSSLEYANLARNLDRRLSVYTVRPRGADGLSKPLRTIEQHADYYQPMLRTRFKDQVIHLGGFSAGGVIAFEVARDSRINVGQVILIDSSLRPRRDFRPHQDISHQPTPNIARDLIDVLRSRDDLKAMLSASWARLSRTAYDTELRNHNYRLLNRAALRRYVPQKLNAAIHFVCAQDGDDDRADANTELWRSLCEGEYHVSRVKSAHLALLKSPNVELVAEQIVGCLDDSRQSWGKG